MKTLLVSAFLVGLLCRGAVAGETHDIYAAHEWGTFTSVQGSDGVQIEWNPYVIDELPKFVYDRSNPEGKGNGNIAALAGKIALVARQRLETPVIYLYAPEEKKVDVHVDFRSGMITEWYPQAENPKTVASRGKAIDWRGVRVLPEAAQASLIAEKNASHYYAARETKAALLAKDSQREKFLFYRGVGSFEAPLRVTQEADGKRLTIRNEGKTDLRHLVVLAGANAKGAELLTKTVDALTPGESRSFALQTDAGWDRSDKQGLKSKMIDALCKEGLYPAEATAMVNTWEDSWLENGTRVLYLLPKEWTDHVLPLTITPTPQEIARVMVGRAEVITPHMEQLVDAAIREFNGKDTAVAEMAIGRVKSFPFARFNDAIVRRLVKKNVDKSYSKAAGELMFRVSQLQAEQKVAHN